MNCEVSSYQWCTKDRILYFTTLVPLLIALIGAAYVLWTASVYLMVVFIFLYVAINVFQAGCCIGCPYRGKYCPAVFGIYLSNLISATVYKNREPDLRFFKMNANLAELFLIITLLFPIYWLSVSNWIYVILFFFLIGLHATTFFPTMCTKCSYNDTCPGGQTTMKLLVRRR